MLLFELQMILFELIVTNFSVARDFILPASDFD
jgi:hypothetical protein